MDTHLISCDILVAGGGPAGVPCALAAARNGAKVVLCQDRAVLGGNASSEIRMHIVGADGSREGIALESEAREGGIIEEIRLEQAVNNPQRSPSMLDLALYDLCREEPNLTLMLNTAVISAEVAGQTITKAFAERQSTQDRYEIKAKIFIDCTGDGRLGFEAGAPFMHGREGQKEFGEDLAPPEADAKTLGSTLLFQARKHDTPMPFRAPDWARKFRAEDLKLRPCGKPGSDLGLDYGYWWVEWGGCLDTIKDNERIRDELLSIMLGVWDFVKNDSGLEASHWALEWFGFLPGKRESRRFIGQHILTEHDLFASQLFKDAIAYGGWPIDTHPPEGVDAIEEPPCVQTRLPWLYNIPLRSCVSAEIRNLMFAGRNISATHIAFASTRVMATCAVIGQGVGTAAALSCANDCQPDQLNDNSELVSNIQQRLLRDDCYLVGMRNTDPADISRTATVTASSEQPGGEAVQVLSGQTRSVHGNCDTPYIQAPPDRAYPGTHRWMSKTSQGLPAWLTLEWDSVIELQEIILIFDTGLHRLLTLTHASGYANKMKWGIPQPETVKDYKIEAYVKEKWQLLAEIKDNYQRRRTHRLPKVCVTNKLKVTVTATNGINHARICELRAYKK